MKILIDVPVVEPVLAQLREQTGLEMDCIEPPEEKTRELDPSRIRDADVLFCTFPPSNFDVMTRLKWVQIASTGYTQLFGLDLPAKGIRATNGRGCFDTPIGEWCVAMMVNLVRNCSFSSATTVREAVIEAIERLNHRLDAMSIFVSVDIAEEVMGSPCSTAVRQATCCFPYSLTA